MGVPPVGRPAHQVMEAAAHRAAAAEENRVSSAAQEALRYLSTASIVSGIAYTAWLMPWTCMISIPAMLLAGAYFEDFPFNVINSIVGSESLEQLAQKTEYVAQVLFGTLFSLGSLELGVGLFFICYGSALATVSSSIASFTIGVLLLSFSLQKLLPSGYTNLFLCNHLAQQPYSVLIQLNTFLREVRQRRLQGDFHLDAQEVVGRISNLFVSRPEDDLHDLSDASIIKKIRHDPVSLSFLLSFLPSERLDSIIAPYFHGPITQSYFKEIEDNLQNWRQLNIEACDQKTVDNILLQISTYTNALRGFLMKLERLKKIEDERVKPLLEEMEKQKEAVERWDRILQDDGTMSLRQRLIARSEALYGSEEHAAYYKLGTIMKDRELEQFAGYLGIEGLRKVYIELERRGLRTIEDVGFHQIWNNVNAWPQLKSNLVDYLDPLKL